MFFITCNFDYGFMSRATGKRVNYNMLHAYKSEKHFWAGFKMLFCPSTFSNNNMLRTPAWDRVVTKIIETDNGS